MRIFAVYTRVALLDKPQWLDEFRQKYDDPNEYHVTLVQPRLINDEETGALKRKISEYFRTFPTHMMKVDFSEFFLEPGSSDDGTIMIKAYPAEKLIELQKSIVAYLKDYNTYQDKMTIDYEKNFVPHITIGRNLTLKRYSKAVSELPQNVDIKATIEEVVLSIVKNDSDKERMNLQNLTVFNLIRI